MPSFRSSEQTPPPSWLAALRRKLTPLRFQYRHGGLGGLLFTLVYRLVNRCTRLLILRPVLVELQDLQLARLDRLASYRHGYVSPDALRPCVADPDCDLSVEFLDYAAAQGDRCYAIFDGELLANYCWCSARPTVIEGDLRIACHPDFLYRYREFTRPSHRGRRLSACNTAESLRLLRHEGKRGFAGYVEADNFVSWNALRRKNHRFTGLIVILGRGAGTRIWHSPRARSLGFRVSREATLPGRLGKLR